MDRLLEAVTSAACLLPAATVRMLARTIRRHDKGKRASLLDVVKTNTGKALVEPLLDAWDATDIGSEELASMLFAASHTFERISKQQSADLVWTGPTTPFVSTRRTEQALLQVISAARQALFITSFVAYDVSSIVKALNDASARGVSISMLLESSQDHGGSISIDVIGKMRALVPTAQLYAWRERSTPFSDGRVHAKIAVADGKICFITSANLTGHAMEQNMEAGVLLTGGQIPKLLHEHLRALVDTRTISPA